MQAASVADTAKAKFTNFRGGDVSTKVLVTGKAGDAGSFELKFHRLTGGFETPRHRHNFEQIRWVFEGKWTLGKGKYLNTNEVGYWTEGVHYGGPAEEDIVAMSVQFGGPSGFGILTYEQLENGRAELSRNGAFVEGIYTWVDSEGRKHNRDGYEAIWELCNKKGIHYPTPPRYSDVIVIHPGSCAPRDAAPGVRVRHLGSFSEGFTAIRHVEADKGARIELGHERQTALMFLRTGVLRDDDRPYPELTGFHCVPGERQAFTVDEPAELLQITLPDISHINAS